MTRLPRLFPTLVLALATAAPVANLMAADDPAMTKTAPATPADPAAPAVPAAPAIPAVPDPTAPAAPATGTPAAPATGTPAVPAEPAAPPVQANLTTPTEPVAPGQDEKKLDEGLTSAVDDFWHYAKVGRYDLAAAAGTKVLGSGQSVDDVLVALQRVAGERGDELDNSLYTWQRIPAMQDVSSKLLASITEGRNRQRGSPAFIRMNIERLATTPRGRLNGMAFLKQSGEIAIPYMIDYLRDTSKPQFQGAVRDALVELGRGALNPLVACTEMTIKDQSTLISVCNILGSIAYPDTAPYLARLVVDKDTVPAVKAAAQSALARMGMADASTLNVGQLFFELSQRFYYGTASISADNREKVAFIWFWDETRGLYKEDVPPAIYGDIMSMRAAEYTLSIDASNGPAVSLWLAADYKREVELPDGAVDTIHKASPSAHFYGTQLGTQYLNQVLNRAQKDKNAAVALRAIKSLEEISGQANLFSQEHQPIIDSMSYPDRLVRFEAAMALGSALPQKPFEGQDQIIPILAEAVTQTGKPNALVVAKDQDQFNQLVKEVGAAGYGTAGGFQANAAVAGAALLPSIDVVVFTEDAGDALIDQTNALLGQSRRMQRVPRLYVVGSKASAYFARAVDNKLVNATTAKEAAALTPVLLKARERSGVLPMDEKTALAYALRATDLMSKLAISHSPVLNLLDALPTLLGTLDDARLDVAKAGASILGYLDSKDIQPTLMSKAGDEKTPDDVKIAALRALSQNAKFFGNHLETGMVESLQKILMGQGNQDVKNAAAEAHGALNLPPEDAKKLIIEQRRVK